MEPPGAAAVAETRRGLITVMCVLVASRMWARAAGVTFDASPLDWYRERRDSQVDIICFGACAVAYHGTWGSREEEKGNPPVYLEFQP
jgi:hypothetical protein